MMMQDAGEQELPLGVCTAIGRFRTQLVGAQGVSGALPHPRSCPSKAYPALFSLEIDFQKFTHQVKLRHQLHLRSQKEKHPSTNITSQLVHENAPQSPPHLPPRFNSCQSSIEVESRLQSRLGIKHQQEKATSCSLCCSKSLLSPSQTKPKLCCHRSPGTKLLKASSQNGSQQLHKPQHLS